MTISIFESISLLSIGFITVLLNLIEVLLIWRKGSGKRSFEIILLGLSFADLFVGFANLLSGADYLSCHLQQVPLDKSRLLYTLRQIIFALSFWASFQHILFIAIERFMAVYYPISHLLFISEKKNSKIQISILWLISFCMVPVYYFKRKVFIILSIVIAYLATGIMLIIYGFITGKIIATEKQSSCNPLRQHRPSQKGNYKTQHLVAINSAIIVACFLLCTCPWMITTTLLVLADYLNVEVAQLFVTVYVLPFNSLLDPLVYFWVFYYKNRQRR